MSKTAKTISIRITLEEFAKARDGLISKGIPEAKLMTNSSILRAAILMCCILNDDPKAPPSNESTEVITQLWKKTRKMEKIDIETLY